MNITCRQGQNAEMYATGYLRNHVSSRFRLSVWKTPRNRTRQPQHALGTFETLSRARKKMKPAPANVCHPILANLARLSNGPDCPAPGLHPNRRRGHAGNRRGSAAYHGAVPIGACATAPDVGTVALGRRREELVFEFRVLFQGGAYPFLEGGTGGLRF